MLIRIALAAALALAVLLPGRVQAEDPVAQVSRVLRLGEVITVMRQEGLDYGQTLRATLFPDQGGAAWAREVDTIYDVSRLQAAFDARFRAALPVAQVPAILAFFDTDRGRRIVSLEIAARMALRDPDVATQAHQLLDDMTKAHAPRLAALRAFAAANDLVESNVSGTMNSDVAFYEGMVAGHAKGFEMTEAQIVAEVAAQEDSIRQDTEDWLYSFLALAYAPLSDADLAAYTDFARSPAGTALNRALFTAFDGVFDAVAHDLGRAAARVLSGHAL
ncbi:MAG: DUF2059 domain-containing protein [Rhodobacteraceae bacterium]|nr:DUF2059 domain-containing protein [Paracoccaceae bacterium]